jgi:lactate dehydrogenase-like 2-hydroxyacid dehydrogenase
VERLFDQQAVSQALVDGRLGGFWCGHYEPEPVTTDNPLLAVPENIGYKWCCRRILAALPQVASTDIST